jgi:hypothetical protein
MYECPPEVNEDMKNLTYGIEYNSAYFTSINSGLTIAQANAKYLKKNSSRYSNSY